MSTYIRKNAWTENNNGSFLDASNQPTDLYWYAKAVQQMQTLPVSNPMSWWFWGAIHGEYLIPHNAKNNGYPDWVNIKYISNVLNPATGQPYADLGTLPGPSLITQFWDQCQHATWYFAPWHRGYLVALEYALRNIITKLTINGVQGPADWALPYWDYLNPFESEILTAFTLAQLPDGTANPLYVVERYGPNGDSKAYVQTGFDDYNYQANDLCQFDAQYSESSPTSGGQIGNMTGYYYGGGETGFQHFPPQGQPLTFGDLENNPHNLVHSMVGGENQEAWQYSGSNAASIEGLMSDPGIAALDPVFYMHHANIDRMWAAWNKAGNLNPTDSSWLNGPGNTPGDEFAMPMDQNGDPWKYTPSDMVTTESIPFYTGTYSYTYSNLNLFSLSKEAPPSVENLMMARLKKLGHPVQQTPSAFMKKQPVSELVGASSTAIALKSGVNNIPVKLDSSAWNGVLKSLVAGNGGQPDEVYLLIEQVTGNNDSNFIQISVNEQPVKAFSLFGLRKASIGTDKHGGGGLNFKVNITDVIDNLHLKGTADLGSLSVEINTKNPIPDIRSVSIGRISVYRS